MTTLPKHLRTRYRYLGIGLRTGPDAVIRRVDLEREMARAASALVGDVGRARIDLRLLGFAFADGYGEAVVRTPRGRVGEARAVLACIGQVDGTPVGLRVRGVSGTVRGCEESYLGRGPESSAESTVAYTGAERSAVRRGDEVDVRTADAFVAATPLDLE